MSEPVLLFCRQWPVTMALTALLARAYTVPVIPVYNREQFVRELGEYPDSPVILGISPHEHVAFLYRLRSLLSGRPVLFVARRFWWTDYCLPAFAGIALCRFCTLDALSDARARRTEINLFKQLPSGGLTERAGMVSEIPDMTAEHILEKANFWLYKRMMETGLSGVESMVLLLLSESRRGNLSPRLLSLYKTGGLYKLGMTKHVINLHRGVKVRPELQVPLPLPDKDVICGRRGG